MNKNTYKQLGKNIKKRRIELGFTQQELADRIGKGLNFVGKIEVAFSKPSFDTIIDIADALQIKLKDLLNFDKEQ